MLRGTRFSVELIYLEDWEGIRRYLGAFLRAYLVYEVNKATLHGFLNFLQILRSWIDSGGNS